MLDDNLFQARNFVTFITPLFPAIWRWVFAVRRVRTVQAALSSVEMADLMSHDRSVGVRGVSAMDQTRARCARLLRLDRSVWNNPPRRRTGSPQVCAEELAESTCFSADDPRGLSVFVGDVEVRWTSSYSGNRP